MKTTIQLTAASLLAFGLAACSAQQAAMGTYQYDQQFLDKHNIKSIELADSKGQSRLIVVPAWQGRVLTSTARGEEGDSYGWINYRFVEKGEVNPQFNPIGGEERFWIGPEGGPFSIYFKPGEEQVYANWHVPPVIDTEEYTVSEKTANHVTFTSKAHLTNASGTAFDLDIRREVSIIERSDALEAFGIKTDTEGIDLVAYKSTNKITNTGKEAWTKDKGLINIWMLGCFNPTPSTTVFIPYDKTKGAPRLNDEYFGKVPKDRLVVKEDIGMIFFKIDGKMRTKIGLATPSAGDICGSYDAERGILTLLRCISPDSPADAPYLNGQWGKQEDPFLGDKINSYNDGPVEDGSIMGPFYEIETSSPGALLKPGEGLTHAQTVIHIQGDKKKLNTIMRELFHIDLPQPLPLIKQDAPLTEQPS